VRVLYGSEEIQSARCTAGRYADRCGYRHNELLSSVVAEEGTRGRVEDAGRCQGQLAAPTTNKSYSECRQEDLKFAKGFEAQYHILLEL